MKVIDVMEEKEDQNEREWQLERETGCSVKWGGCIEKLRFEQKLEKEIISGKQKSFQAEK